MAYIETYTPDVSGNKPFLVVTRYAKKSKRKKNVTWANEEFTHRLEFSDKGIRFIWPKKRQSISPIPWHKLQQFAYSESKALGDEKRRFSRVIAEGVTIYYGSRLKRTKEPVMYVAIYLRTLIGRQAPDGIILTIGLTPERIRFGLPGHDVDSSAAEKWATRFEALRIR